GAAERDLIRLGAGFLETENSDVADVVMAARIDATGNIDFELADLARAGGIAKPLRKALGDGNRAGRCKRTIIEPRAGNDVSHEASICRGETMRGKLIENFGQLVERDMR